jgi:uncharacterized membrane protein YcaP (DUF421 family)
MSEATILLAKDTPLAEGIVAFTLLIGMQFVITWLSVRSAVVGDLVKSQPALLLNRGELLPAALRRERVTEAEVLAAVRAAGFASLGEVAAVVLETDGSLTAVPRSERHASVLAGLGDRVADGGGSAGGRRTDGDDRSGLHAEDATRTGPRR